jgi:DNA/RNA-binding domain of Phe-tRNA-synthetase-like protein
MVDELLQLTAGLADRHAGLKAGAWYAEQVTTTGVGLPPLAEVAAAHPEALDVAQRMSAVFRRAGAKGRSPVEFQIRKVRDGSMRYSGRNGLVDLLLYTEVRTGLIVGLHDAARLELPVRFGLGSEAAQPSFSHISGSERSVGDEEPVLLSGEAIVGSLLKGPDDATKVVAGTERVWGVVFGAPDDSAALVDEALDGICAEGERQGAWRVLAKGMATGPTG